MEKCPKDVLEIAVFLAVIYFNEGSKGLTNVTEAQGIRSGTFIESSFEQKDASQLKMKNIKSSEKSKQRRKKLRAMSKQREEDEERLMYQGHFSLYVQVQVQRLFYT